MEGEVRASGIAFIPSNYPAPISASEANDMINGRQAMSGKALRQAVAYLRTSSAANVGADKDSERRQGEAVEAFARSSGYEIIGSYYDAAVSGQR